jgi:uncharacterized protein (TIGR02145 family)
MKKFRPHSCIFPVVFAGLFLSLLISCKKEATKAIPTVTLSAVTNITATTAATGGNITSDGGSEVTARGVCWSTSSNPTTAASKTTDGTGPGSFSSSITGLTPGAAYNIRAYATNAVGTAYSGPTIFSALASTPVLITTPLSLVTTTSAASGGNIPNDGGAPITARGVCWNTSSGPTTGNSKTTDGTGIGLFTSSLTGLTANTTYYVRAYATNSAGTSYGDEAVLKTFTGTVTDFDGNVYYTVTIGTQVWMAGNLKTIKYSDGTDIPQVTDKTAWSALLTPGYCWMNNDKATYKDTYGALYNYYVVDPASNGGKNVCPTGWHVPTNNEWLTLTTYLNGEPVAGGKLKESGILHWQTPNTAGTNETGFTALPAGSHGYDFIVTGTETSFWTSTEYEAHSAWVRYITFSNSMAHPQYTGKINGNSIRCLKN